VRDATSIASHFIRETSHRHASSQLYCGVYVCMRAILNGSVSARLLCVTVPVCPSRGFGAVPCAFCGAYHTQTGVFVCVERQCVCSVCATLCICGVSKMTPFCTCFRMEKDVSHAGPHTPSVCVSASCELAPGGRVGPLRARARMWGSVSESGR